MLNDLGSNKSIDNKELLRLTELVKINNNSKMEKGGVTLAAVGKLQKYPTLPTKGLDSQPY